MSYYFNNGAGRIWSDIKYTVTTRQFEDVYSYKTLLDPQCKTGIYYYTPSFYIKDGSTPWFDAWWNDNGEITTVNTRYLCVGRFTISSLSSKYTLPDNFSCYYIPANTTPELIKYDVFKNDNGTFKSLFNTVDLNKGGKVYWRIPESTYSGYNFSNFYSVFEHLEDKTNVLHSDCRNDNFINDRKFVYFGKDTSNNFHPNIGNFIKCTPSYYTENKFGFEIDNALETGSIAPNNFRLDKTLIPGEYTKLKVKMDALIVYGNNGFGEPYETKSRIDNRCINTYGSFSSSNIPGTNPYCLALFYASNNDEKWTIPNSTYEEDHPYINNGEIFSNLKTNGNSTPLVKDTNHYKIKYIKYNNSEVKEVQEWTNKHLWGHLRPLLITTGWDKLYPAIREETATCFSAEPCPICTSDKYKGSNGAGSMKCDYVTLLAYPIYYMSNGTPTQLSPNDVKMPYYEKGHYDTQKGVSSNLNWINGFNCCGGKGYVYKHYVKSGKLYASTETATCPLCTQPDATVGKGWNYCRCVDATYKDVWTVNEISDDFGNVFENYKLQTEGREIGRINCTRCGAGDNRSTKKKRPYKDQTVMYNFKYCDKDNRSFSGYIFNGELNTVSAASKYKKVNSFEEVTPENIPNDKKGIFYYTETVKNQFPNYAEKMGTADWFSAYSANVTTVSSNWIVYVNEHYTNGDQQYYYTSNNNNPSPSISGVGYNAYSDKYNPVWYAKTSATNVTTADDFGNVLEIDKWNTTGNTPACACNFTFANVQLNYDINLSECTGKYIHIAYPYTTIFNATQTNVDSFMIPQISMSYEAE